MSDIESAQTTSRRHHIVRLVLVMAFLLGLFYLVAVVRVIDVEAVRGAVEATGPAAPVAYVVVSAALGAVFVPGPILAAGSGVLFGPALGLFVTLGATVGTAIIAGVIGRRAGRNSARELLGAERADRLDQFIERRRAVGRRRAEVRPRGLGRARILRIRCIRGSVVADSCWRIHRVDAAGVRLHGAGCVDRGPLLALAYAAIAIWCITAVVGAFATHQGYRRWRRGRSERTGRPTIDCDVSHTTVGHDEETF